MRPTGYGLGNTIRPPTSNETIGIYEYFQYVNDIATGGLFFPLILSVIWIIVFINTLPFKAPRAWTIASFLTTSLSMILAVLNLVNVKYMYLSMFFLAIGAVWLKLDTNK